MSQTEIILFVVTSLAIIMTPGQDMVLVMSRAISQGSRAGIVTAGGVSLGLLLHTSLAALGMGSLLIAYEPLFNVIKFVGAGYLFFLGIRLIFFSKRDALGLTTEDGGKNGRLFFDGAFANISNPQITIFYLAFLPQFIPNGYTNPTLLLVVLGVSFAALTFVVKAPVGYFAGILSAWIQARPAILQWVDRVSGMILIGLGIRLALQRRA